jgi:hypothetical protein
MPSWKVTVPVVVDTLAVSVTDPQYALLSAEDESDTSATGAEAEAAVIVKAAEVAPL